MNRIEALELLARDRRIIPEGKNFSAAYFEPSDGPGIARLFYAVYGDGYPIDWCPLLRTYLSSSISD